MKRFQDSSVFPKKENRVGPSKRVICKRTLILTLIGALMSIAFIALKSAGYNVRKEIALIAMFICGCALASSFIFTFGKKK